MSILANEAISPDKYELELLVVFAETELLEYGPREFEAVSAILHNDVVSNLAKTIFIVPPCQQAEDIAFDLEADWDYEAFTVNSYAEAKKLIEWYVREFEYRHDRVVLDVTCAPPTWRALAWMIARQGGFRLVETEYPHVRQIYPAT